MAKERPIIFGAESIKAILEGRKTQTRRVCQGARELSRAADWQLDRCPYGRPGDRLWVREAWADSGPSDNRGIYYRADFIASKPELVPGGGNWTTPIFMPRWASRITLEIVGIRVERVQEITAKDAVSEGAQLDHWITEEYPAIDHGVTADARTLIGRFKRGWNALNEKRGFGWESNPFVWVIEFRRAER